MFFDRAGQSYFVLNQSNQSMSLPDTCVNDCMKINSQYRFFILSVFSGFVYKMRINF